MKIADFFMLVQKNCEYLVSDRECEVTYTYNKSRWINSGDNFCCNNISF